MFRININGKTITGERSVCIINGHLMVDEKDVTTDDKGIKVEVHGDVTRIDADVCNTITVSGGVGEISTQTGDVRCKNVEGNICTMSGDVECGPVTGSIRTMSGDVKLR